MSLVSEPSADKRRHERKLASGPITLWWGDASLPTIQGRLLDMSETGFRVAHNCIALGQGQQVHFQYADGEGTARTIWTRILSDSAESGLLILPAED